MSKLYKVMGLVIGFVIFSTGYTAPVDINSASAEDIAASLQGIGSKQAAAIVAYREQHGPFTSLDQLTEVKGVGAKTISKNKADILLDGAKMATSKSQPKAKANTSSAQAVNINTADAEQLSTLQGIGPEKAAAIIHYREQMGPFKSLDELLNVSGIGAKTLEKNRSLIRLN
jgi:competence protein ComEA